jgi:hypothetical protein
MMKSMVFFCSTILAARRKIAQRKGLTSDLMFDENIFHRVRNLLVLKLPLRVSAPPPHCDPGSCHACLHLSVPAMGEEGVLS